MFRLRVIMVPPLQGDNLCGPTGQASVGAVVFLVDLTCVRELCQGRKGNKYFGDQD